MYEYCVGKHWSLDWMEENQTATYFLRSRLFTYDINLVCKTCFWNKLHQVRSWIFVVDGPFKGIQVVRIEFFFILKVANIRFAGSIEEPIP
jgi:hypothetical protein